MHIYTYIHKCIYIHIHTYIHIHIYIDSYTHTHTYTHIYYIKRGRENIQGQNDPERSIFILGLLNKLVAAGGVIAVGYATVSWIIAPRIKTIDI